jgi:hypothetical protein
MLLAGQQPGRALGRRRLGRNDKDAGKRTFVRE